jgi:hypothetical protein
MSDAHLRTVRQALAELPSEALSQWRVHYLPGEGDELKIRSLVERHEAKMRAAGRETTIRAVWVELANAAASGDDPEMRAAAGLAAMAMGLRRG